MNRRKWLSSLLALPLVLWMFRIAKPVEPNVCPLCYLRAHGHKHIQTFNNNPSISVDMDCSSGEWTEVRGDGTGAIEFIVHDAKPSKDLSWSCHDKDGHVSFIAPADIGPAEIKERKRLAREARNHE